MTRSSLSLAIVACLLTACGGGNSNKSTPTTTSSSSTTSTASSIASSSKSSIASSASSSASSIDFSKAKSLVIEAEDYLRFEDSTSDNKGGQYRTDGVDIEKATDEGGGFNVGYIDPDEWLEFTINVTKPGTFHGQGRTASQQTGGSFQIAINGTAVGKAFDTANTGGWQSWQDTTIQSLGTISAGTHSLCIQMKSGPFNLNWFKLLSADGGEATLGTKPVGDTSPCKVNTPPPTPTVPTLIKLNQLGFKLNSEKLAVIPAVNATTFKVVNKADKTVALSGNLTESANWEPALDLVKIADFSSLKTAGNYEIQVDGVEKVAEFSISDNAYKAVSDGSLKAFYYNRASTALLEANAGVYKRAAGHPDDKVLVHASAKSDARPEGTIISSPKGWYDAGDYNKYIVNSGISTYTLLAAYESFSDYFKTQNLNIPESGDAVPDILNEAMWNLEWMLTMQDPNDGGVYHKLTSKGFSGFDMPEVDKSDRYVVQKATPATLDFAATMAAASRIYAKYETQFPGVSAKMLKAAKDAYAWAKANPAIYYNQPSDIQTGAYGDGDASDEFVWAAAELYIATKDDTYYADVKLDSLTPDVPWWGGVKTLGLISLVQNRDSLTAAANKTLIQSKLDGLAKSIADKRTGSAYSVPLVAGDFNWGSNSGVLNQAWILLEAYQLDNTKTSYLNAAQASLDYILGRNATDYSFVTGFGKTTPKDIHHRPSAADGIPGAIPGFLAGGPNAGQEDKSNCGSTPYPSKLPAKSFIDSACSYASNEIAINWNAPLVYVSAGIQVLTK